MMKKKLNYLNLFFYSNFAGIFSVFFAVQPVNALTFVLDFNDPEQANTVDRYNAEISDFDVTAFGFEPTDFDLVANAVLDKVESHFYDIPTVGEDARSPIPDGQQLDLDFEIGDIATPPTNGDREYYFIQIGSEFDNDIKHLGQAGLGFVRTDTGLRFPSRYGAVPGSVFTNNINNMSGLGSSLKSGNLEATVNAIAGTLSHEIGHTLSLEHVYKASSEVPNGLSPLLGTGALDLPNIDRISDRSFSFSAFGEGSGGDSPQSPFEPTVLDLLEPHIDVARDPFAPLPAIPSDAPELNNIQRLYDVVGTRDAVAVPFEFSPSMGLILVGITWGIISLPKRL